MLGALFYPKGTKEKPIKFESLYIPYIYKEIYFEGVYVDILNQKKDMVIVDVGANIGVTVQHFRNFAKKVYAIEPSPEHFEALAKNKEFNEWDNVELFNYGLADTEGEMEMAQNDDNRTMNTLVIGDEKDETGRYILKTGVPGLMGTMGAHGYNSKVKVKTKSIDQFFEENKIGTVDFMKFDPEGSEDMILRSDGFLKVYKNIRSIMVEFHFPTWPNLVAYMESLGFTARRYESSAIIVLFTRG